MSAIAPRVRGTLARFAQAAGRRQGQGRHWGSGQLRAVAAGGAGPPPPGNAPLAGEGSAAPSTGPLAGEGGGPPPPASDVPPAAASSEPASAQVPPPAADAPPPPASGHKCGGFFFTCDPNIGLWNDRVNPTWRLTFTDLSTNEKQRTPYAMAIQHRGPHADLGLRFQFGFVSCDGSFAQVPQTLAVNSGWEATFPLPFSAVRLSLNVADAHGAEGQPAPITVYCVDYTLGISAGVQKVVSGSGVKGIPELSWKGDIAMAGFVVMVLGSIYSLVTLPNTWQEFIEEMRNFSLEDEQMEAAFEAMDVDGDGFISREDLREFMRRESTGEQIMKMDPMMDADMIFDLMDIKKTGRVSFDDFEDFLEAAAAAQAAAQGGGGAGARPQAFAGGGVAGSSLIQPFGGALTPNPMGLDGLSFRPPTHAGPRGPAW